MLFNWLRLRAPRAIPVSIGAAHPIHFLCSRLLSPPASRLCTNLCKATLYDLLGVSPIASEDEIKSAFRQTAKRLHPDIDKEEGSEARFVKINNAYETLSDIRSRATYDRTLRHLWEEEENIFPYDQMSTVEDCLAALGVDMVALSRCKGMDEEWSILKQAYFQAIMRVHPDMGGEPDSFRGLQSAFDVLRELKESKKVRSFAKESKRATSKAYRCTFRGFEGMPTPSWEFYAAAAGEPVPTYRVEPSKSSRSSCVVKGETRKCKDECIHISKGALRVGSVNPAAGNYQRWCHLSCWCVPSKVWLGLPDPGKESDVAVFVAALAGMNCFVLCGFRELETDDQKLVARHVMDKSNWASLIVRGATTATKQHRLVTVEKLQLAGGKTSPVTPAAAAASIQAATSAASIQVDESDASIQVDEAETSLSRRRSPSGPERFVIPVPGINNAPPGSLAGHTVVLTGTFPELGGGAGLNLGKDRAKAMVESFGGRVTGAVSGRTTLLIVGKDPGTTKVGSARSNPKVKLVTLMDLQRGLETGCLEDMGDGKLLISSFSGGFYNNGLAAEMTTAELKFLAGTKLLGQMPAKFKKNKKKPAAPRFEFW